MKRVRILLRVSSNQQLDADGDLSVQRRLVREYIGRHEDWLLDDKEYFEGSNSGYKNAVSKRDILQEALADAKKNEYDILAAYKDDRIGRRMWEIGAYVMTLKSCNVDIYTVKDGCISPENDDIMGQMMLALRYGNAQKSSSDTGMRVKDTAEKLVREGRFMGGAAPYGYRLVFSGKLSKHGRALHELEIVPEQAALVRKIYELSCYREFGSVKIAGLLNADEYDRSLAPHGEWKCGTVTGILTNPVYAGYTVYKRRERIGGKNRRKDSRDWIRSENPAPELCIIDEVLWNLTQEKRKNRAARYQKNAPPQGCAAFPVIARNDGRLPLQDVLYCGFCGRKMVRGTRYSYWTLRATGERRSRKIPLYRCPAARGGISHGRTAQFRADLLEHIIFDCAAGRIDALLREEDIAGLYRKELLFRQKKLETERRRFQKELSGLTLDINVLREHIPDAVAGNYPLPVEELSDALRRCTEQKSLLERKIRDTEGALKELEDNHNRLFHTNPAVQNGAGTKGAVLPTWPQLFLQASPEAKRIIINRLAERIEVTGTRIVIRFRG